MGGAIPYCGTAPAPEEAWTRWNLDPPLLAGLVLLALAYGTMRRAEPGAAVRDGCFAAAWLLLWVAFVSPLCALASALFSARVAHHLLLIAVAAPLLAAAVPIGAWSDRLRGPAPLFLATLAQTVAVWIWHAPAPYALALSDSAVYWAMQASLLGSAVAFWTLLRVMADEGGRAISALLATLAQMGLLGALITFAPHPLYAPHFLTTAAWGFTPLEDQQLAGLVMWIPAGLPYLLAALRILSGWLAGSGRADSDGPA